MTAKSMAFTKVEPAVPDFPESVPRLLVVGRDPGIRSTVLEAMTRFLGAGDLLVVNDAATFPASLSATTADARPLEIRLLPKPPGTRLWEAVLFGAGDWRMRTEDRPAPPGVAVGDWLSVHETLAVRVAEVSSISERWVKLDFGMAEAETWAAVYRHGRPVQYAHTARPYSLDVVQTSYPSRPWAAEMPSAGKPLHWRLLAELQRNGVRIASLTHATGLSSVGDPRIDARFPFPEFFQIPESTVAAVAETHRRGGRVVAVGTSVVRALEGANVAGEGKVSAGFGETDLVIDHLFQRKVVHGILTGIHEMGESHFRLLEAFAPRERLAEGLRIAHSEGYRLHEFGDSSLIFSS